MRKIFTILLLSYVLFVIELFLEAYVYPAAIPNLLLLLIIFVNLWLGIRYSIFTAVVAGLLKDSFSADFFGLHILVFIMCAYATTLFARYLYQRGSTFSRLLLVACIVLLNFFLEFILHWGTPGISSAFSRILVPQFVLTLLLMEFVFQNLRLCASRFFV